VIIAGTGQNTQTKDVIYKEDYKKAFGDLQQYQEFNPNENISIQTITL